MGSISYPIPYGSNVRAEVAKYVREATPTNEIIASNSAPGDYEWGGVYFAAHRKPDGFVWASITLFCQRQGDVVIKMMDETVGPTAVGVGRNVLAALSPLRDDAHEWERNWREEAHRYQERRQAALAARGKQIKLAHPVNLQSGAAVDLVEVVDLRLWKTPGLRRIRPNWDWFMRDWEVIR